MALGIPPEGDGGLQQSFPESSQTELVEPIIEMNQALTEVRAVFFTYSGVDTIIPVINNILERMKPNAYNPVLANEIANRFESELDLPQHHKPVMVSKNLEELQVYLKAIPEIRLYLTLATNENFGSWQERLKEASGTIEAVNKSNKGLNLKTDYDLLTLIKTLAATNPENAELTFTAIERMKEPRLVIVPAGLNLNNLTEQLRINHKRPYINPIYEPYTVNQDAAVYLIEAGDIKDVRTQPEAVQKAADANGNNTLLNQELREIAKDVGLYSDEHVYGLLGVMKKIEDPNLRLDQNTFSVLSKSFTDSQNRVAVAEFQCLYYFITNDRPFAYDVARVRPAVMAKLPNQKNKKYEKTIRSERGE